MLATNSELERPTAPRLSVPLVEPAVPPVDDLAQLLAEIWRSGRVTNSGLVHDQLEEAIGSFLGADCALTSSGTSALEVALAALDLPVGGEVIVPAFSFPATYQSILRARLRPMYCDVDPTTLTMDVPHVQSLVNSTTVALLPVHIFGCLAFTVEIDQLGALLGLSVLYDAAAAFGARLDGRPCGQEGTASAFSFHATKVFTTIEGGAVVSRDSELISRSRALRNFGLRAGRPPLDGGLNAKMSELHAAIGILNLGRLDHLIAGRKLAVEHYRSALDGVPGIEVLAPDPGAGWNASHLVVRIDPSTGDSADAIQGRLARHGIDSRRYFGSEYIATDANLRELPVTAALATQTLCLPLFPEMTESLVSRICSICTEVLL